MVSIPPGKSAHQVVSWSIVPNVRRQVNRMGSIGVSITAIFPHDFAPGAAIPAIYAGPRSTSRVTACRLHPPIAVLLAIAVLWSTIQTYIARQDVDNDIVYVFNSSWPSLAFLGASGVPCTNHWTYIIVPPTTIGTRPRERISLMAS